MSWAKLLGRYVTAEPPSKAELDNLRSIVTRSLQDAVAPGLSADARFIMAYDAARTLSLIVVRSEGYRPRSVGGHYNTFLALQEADPTFATQSTYFDGCRHRVTDGTCATATSRARASWPSNQSDCLHPNGIREKAKGERSFSNAGIGQAEAVHDR